MTSNPAQVGGWKSTAHKYDSVHELQRLTVWTRAGDQSAAASQKSKRIWVIYIHGGAWRDPTQSDASFIPALTQLTTSSTYTSLVNNDVQAFASIDYRLSAHPNHPQDITTTPSSRYRDAKHPDHVLDVQSAIRFLQETYRFAENYILAGHSCGATLALQCVMPTSIPELPRDFTGPVGIAGLAGIYDLRVLRDTNSHPEYARFIRGAFGDDETLWDTVSPARYKDFQDTWPEGRVVILASSRNDELVDDPQIDSMGEMGSRVQVVKMKNELLGTHDEIWSRGIDLARVIAEMVEKVNV
ncbi:hypothetical protein PVAG01_09722 [Phlyctema vagabunda]|uniref:Kynurenine formamidase n=1 Tax=Phlyctema vagabunda TaxID=108571 RepID=A0ABR4P855_9HELO